LVRTITVETTTINGTLRKPRILALGARWVKRIGFLA
jgi:hypothetical protein